MNKGSIKQYFGLLCALFIVGYFAVQIVRAQTISPSVSPSPEPSTTNAYFLKIDGIPGESKDTGHENEINILSFKWGELQGSQSGAGSNNGKVTMQDFHFVMKYNKASPKLFLLCANGEHISKATFVVRKAGGDQEDYLKWTLSDVMCSQYQTGGSNPEVPTDDVSFSFGKIEVEYKAQKPDGTLDSPIKAGWDLKQNKSF